MGVQVHKTCMSRNMSWNVSQKCVMKMFYENVSQNQDKNWKLKKLKIVKWSLVMKECSNIFQIEISPTNIFPIEIKLVWSYLIYLHKRISTICMFRKLHIFQITNNVYYHHGMIDLWHKINMLVNMSTNLQFSSIYIYLTIREFNPDTIKHS